MEREILRVDLEASIAARQERLSKSVPLPAATEALGLALQAFRYTMQASREVPGFAPQSYEPESWRTAEVLADLLEDEIGDLFLEMVAAGDFSDA